MDAALDWAWRLDVGQVVGLALLENVILFLIAVGVGNAVLRLPTVVRLLPDPGRISRLQAWLAGGAILMNSLITVAGWGLWKTGIIHLNADPGLQILTDFVLLLLLMDLLMYAGHAVAHRPQLFPLAHALHHRFVDARPATLYALHPLEICGFGGLWLAALATHAFSVWAILAYTAVNLIFGIFGHLGVEVLPLAARRSRVFRWVATPSLHAGHHVQPSVNLGFYTSIWDRLFGTLAPDYDQRRLSTEPEPYALVT
ncbi:sterol desaturase family protein [Micromonospora phytophila]|uniref:sterol desaturase family protein n=1 Tax=Micromonospora phytophila TaxID=709888 RepID=UPI00202FBB3F|nr:sterol desaturase family protein [Micromonospora phytophila]MCM0673254.1 sterol desaturase family protein [Micromonospora phytophila]